MNRRKLFGKRVIKERKFTQTRENNNGKFTIKKTILYHI